jgi:cytochrome c oxidase assembly protein subunit 15
VASATVVVMAAQGVLGYVQYFNRIPALLVGFHVFGAVCVFVCVQQLVLELSVADDRIAVDAGATHDATTTAGIAVAP